MPVWLRAVAFLLLVPGAIAGWLPWYVAGAPALVPQRETMQSWVGLVVVTCGAAVVLRCTRDFVRRGRGTPAPYDPPVALVTSGLYRLSRNPMYVGVLMMIVGQAFWYHSGSVFIYAVVVGIAFHARVRLYEEPRLARSFGPAYADYCARVPRWLPNRAARLKRSA